MSNRKRLITGGAGLIGSEIPAEWGLKPTRSQLDLNSYPDLHTYLSSKRVDEIVHLAAKVGGVKANNDQVLDFFNENLNINGNIIRACSHYNIKKATFMLSTCVFPATVSYPVDERSLHSGEPHHTNFGYAYAKRMLEVGARALRQQKGIQARCIIPCNIYGKHDNYDIINGHVIPSLIHKCYLASRDGTPFRVWGSGEAEREFIYAPDIARAIRMIHDDERDIPNLMIVSPSMAYTIRRIVEIIADCFGYKGQILFDTTKPEGILRKPTVNFLFKRHYGDFKFTPIEQGIYETCMHVKEHYDSIRK